MWVEQLELLHCWEEWRKTQALWKKCLVVSYGVNIHLFYDAAIVLLGNHPREMETYPHGTRMSTAASSSGEWKNELWHIHTMDKKRQTTVHKITREISKLRRWAKEARHTHKTRCMSPFIWRVKTGETNLWWWSQVSGAGRDGGQWRTDRTRVQRSFLWWWRCSLPCLGGW